MHPIKEAAQVIYAAPRRCDPLSPLWRIRSIAPCHHRRWYAVLMAIVSSPPVTVGLAMSPGLAAAIPLAATVLGGQQSARTLHFFVSVLLMVFLVVHVVMVCVAGVGSRMRAMITGRPARRMERI